MGEEITTSRFSRQDFDLFKENLVYETGLLEKWFASDTFDSKHGMAGFELEAWIVDERCAPKPINDQLLGLLNNPLVVPELARFNVELNGPPRIG